MTGRRRPGAARPAALALLAGLAAAAPAKLAAQGATLRLYAERGPAVGRAAPDFELPWADRTAVGSAEYPFTLWKTRGYPVVLAFVSSATGAEGADVLRALRDRRAELFGPGVVVAVVSPERVETLREAARLADAPFPLLSDTGQAVASAFGAAVRAGVNRPAVRVISAAGDIAWRTDRFTSGERDLQALAAAVRRARTPE